MRCKHIWTDLYQEPKDSGFKEVYNARQLDIFKKCPTCSAIGKRGESGSILQLPLTKWQSHYAQARQWTENLKTFASTQKSTQE